MKKFVAFAVFMVVVGFIANADDKEERKKRIMEKVKELVEKRNKELIDEVEKYLDEKLTTKATVQSEPPYLGFYIGKVDEDDSDVLAEKGYKGAIKVRQIVPESPAQEYKLSPDDLIVKIDAVVISTPDDLKSFLSSKKAGDKVSFVLIRDGKEMTIDLILGKAKNLQSPVTDKTAEYFQKEIDRLYEKLQDLKSQNSDLKKTLKSLRSEMKKFKKDGHKEDVEEKEEKDEKESSSDAKPYIGVQFKPLTDEESEALEDYEGGLKVMEVDEGSPAEIGGIKSGDIIVEINGNSVASTKDLLKVRDSLKPRSSATITVIRDGKKQDIKITVGSR